MKEYRRTLFDRFGPTAAEYIRAGAYPSLRLQENLNSGIVTGRDPSADRPRPSITLEVWNRATYSC